MSSHCSSTDRVWLRLAFLLRALRRPLLSRTWTMSKFVLCWLYHCTGREAKADRSQVYHSVRENSMSSSSQHPKSTEKPFALFSSKTKPSQEAFSDREDFSSGHQQVLGNNEPSFRFSHPEKFVKSLLECHRDRVFAEAKSEILKQECKVDSLNTCIREFQRQAHSHRLELDLHIADMKNPEESKFDYRKNWLYDKQHFEILVSGLFMKLKN